MKMKMNTMETEKPELLETEKLKSSRGRKQNRTEFHTPDNFPPLAKQKTEQEKRGRGACFSGGTPNTCVLKMDLRGAGTQLRFSS